MPSLHESLTRHLQSFGLRRFTSDADYFAWQRRVLSPSELDRLHQLVDLKRRGTPADETAFYDATADPRILPVLYSQRYDYYCAVGPPVAASLADAKTVLDVGCGIGILALFYARQYPEKQFVGIDRSPVSIRRAAEQAAGFALANVRFERRDITDDSPSESYDCIIATHAVLQAEHDAGTPSRDWTTFERSKEGGQQRAFEVRTGLGPRLDGLCARLSPDGRVILCEKTRQLARRIPFQRALAARGFQPIAPPRNVRYQLVEELADDGPLYVVRRGRAEEGPGWDETPEADGERPYDPADEPAVQNRSDEPLYENHGPSAQYEWARLQGKRIVMQATKQEPDGRQLHVELGTAGGRSYVYCANTFDQRQLVVMRDDQRSLLEQYYRDIVGS